MTIDQLVASTTYAIDQTGSVFFALAGAVWPLLMKYIIPIAALVFIVRYFYRKSHMN